MQLNLFWLVHACNMKSSNGLTLIELLISIAVIVILGSITFPILKQSQNNARRTFCTGNMRQWAIALSLYCSDNEASLPDDGSFTGSSDNGWMNVLPAYLEVPRYKDIPGYGTAITNLPLFHIWTCPGRKFQRPWKAGQNYYVCYAMNSELDDVAGEDGEGVNMAQIPNPPATVVLFDTCADKLVNNYKGFALGKATLSHISGGNILFADGHVSYIKKEQILTASGRWITNDTKIIWTPNP